MLSKIVLNLVHKLCRYFHAGQLFGFAVAFLLKGINAPPFLSAMSWIFFLEEYPVSANTNPRILNGDRRISKKGESCFFQSVISQFIINNTSEQAARCILSQSRRRIGFFILIEYQILRPINFIPEESSIKFIFLFIQSVNINLLKSINIFIDNNFIPL